MKGLIPKVFIASLIIGGLILFYYHYSGTNQVNNGRIESPLPEFLTKVFPHIAGSADLWKPNITVLNKSNTQEPKITAQSAVSYDLTSGKLLYEHNIKKEIPMASLTKIMTAIIALENFNLIDEIEITKADASVGENSMGLSVSEILKVEDLLYGLILHSGNDAAEALARASPFGRDNFVYLMNKKAEELGLTNTHFTNPTGLEGDGQQYSTTYDLLVITRYALQNPDFAKVVATVDYEIPYTQAHKYIYLYNETNLLTSYPGVKGVKTGYTPEAGLCLVTYLEYEGHRIIAVLLNGENRRQEMKDLLDYSLKTLGVKPPSHN